MVIEGANVLVLLPSISYGAEPRINRFWRSWLRSGTGPRYPLTDASSRCAGVLTWGILAAITAALGGMPANGAAAQGTVVIGGDGKPNVEVDLGVIETLGRPSGPLGMRPWLRHVGSTDPSARLRLLPPSGSRHHRDAGPTVSTARLKLAPPMRAPRAAPLPKATSRPLPPPAMTAPAPPSRLAVPKAPPAAAEPRIVAPAPTTRPGAAPPPPGASAPPPAPPKAVARAPVAVKPAGSPPSRVAALPRAAKPTAVERVLRLKFTTESISLSPSAEEQLRALAGELSGDTARLWLKAYAGEADRTASAARRLSLSRALAVRSFLIEQGIRSTRIGVRAFGFPTDGGPTERVDVELLTR